MIMIIMKCVLRQSMVIPFAFHQMKLDYIMKEDGLRLNKNNIKLFKKKFYIKSAFEIRNSLIIIWGY